MLFHAFEKGVLLLLHEPGEPKRAGRADFPLAKSRLPLCRELFDQGDALGDPRLSVIEEGCHGRCRHAVVGHQGMGDAGFVQSRDRAPWTVRQQQAFLVIGGSPAMFDDDGNFGASSRPPSLEPLEAIDDFITVFDRDHPKRQRGPFAWRAS